MSVELFQSAKDIKSSNPHITYFNNQMYLRKVYSNVNWWVWTDTVKWQLVRHEGTLQMLNESFERWRKDYERN